MVSDKRKFCGSFGVRFGTQPRIRVQLSPAPLHGGPEGLYRICINRRWYDLPEGDKAFFTFAQAGELAAGMAAGHAPELAPRPDLPRGTPVRVPNGQTLAGQALYDVTRTNTEPFQGLDGKWHVAVTIYGKGTIMVPVDTLQRKAGT